MKKRYFISRAFLICFLVVPFVLTYSPLGLEPYPAVIFPGGGHLGNHLGSEFRVSHEPRLYMLTQHGEIKVDYARLFKPIPVLWGVRVMNNGFGLRSSRSDLSSTTREEGISWIKGRLNKLTGVDEKSIKGLKYYRCRLQIYYGPEGQIKEECRIKSVTSL